DQVQTITVKDNTPPTFTRPADIMIFRDGDCEYDAGVTETGDVTDEDDNCGVGEATYVDVVDDSDPCAVVITRTWSLKDDCGNAASDQVQTITVKDNTPPTPLCQDITLELNPLTGFVQVPETVAGQSSDNCGPIEIELLPLQLTCANLGLNTINVTLIDECDNMSACTAQVLLVLPGGLPTLPSVNLNQSGPAVICSGEKYTLDFGGANNPPGTQYMVTWTISPTFTNTAPSDNNVFLHGGFGDPNPPAIGEGMVTTMANMLMGVIDNINLNSVDIQFTVTPKIGLCAGTPQTVTVTVRPLPQVLGVSPALPAGICSGGSVGPITVQHNITAGLANNQIMWMWSGTNITASPASGSDTNGSNGLVVGATTLTNTGTATQTATLTIIPKRLNANNQLCEGPAFTLTVEVEPKPVIQCPNPIVATTAGAGCDTTATLTHPLSNLNPANCSGTLSIAFSNGMPAPASLPTGGPVTPGGTGMFTFAKGVTVVTYTLTDNANNTATCSFTVTVTDNDPPAISCPAPLTVSCAADLTPGPTAPTGTATATDNCLPTPVLNYVDNTSPNPTCPQYKYVLFRTWTAEDGAGNKATCTQVITVDDSTPPTITCPANITVNCTASTLPDATGEASATDNCTPVDSIGIGYNDGATQPGACPQSYTIPRTWTAVDACG
ncbi:MAG: HYR domain-containing protein, partial [Saprospiraceae bacterium]|nr:HYR domain-containing protein [Saprospiraceae bacterium]